MSQIVRIGGSVAEVFEPATRGPRASVVWFCLPGGGMSRRYFDIDVPSEFGNYSMARHVTAAGYTVVTIDHPAVGESDRPDDLYSLSPPVVAGINAEVVGKLQRELDCTYSIGVGHSMGGLLSVFQQAAHHSHHALALLGHGGPGLLSQLSALELSYAGDPEGALAALPDLVRERFGQPLPKSGTATSEYLVRVAIPGPVRAGADRCADRLLALCGLTSMLPGASDPQRAAIDVPLFLGIGEMDITGPPHEIPANFPSAKDITLYVLAGAGHNHHVAPTRELLWDRMISWAASRIA